MRKLAHFVLAVGAVFAFTTGASADPIGTRGRQCYGALWVRATETDCDRVCRRAGMSAESMTLSSASTQKIFVCRHKGRTRYTFGEQSSGNCRVLDGRTGRKQRTYECLCVRSGCAVDDSRPPRPGRPTAGDGRTPGRMSEEDCLTRLNSTIEKMGVRPDRKTYARARRYCASGDLRSAVKVIRRASRSPSPRRSSR